MEKMDPIEDAIKSLQGLAMRGSVLTEEHAKQLYYVQQSFNEHREIFFNEKANFNFYSLSIVHMLSDLMSLLGDLESQSENFVWVYFDWIREKQIGEPRQEAQTETVARVRKMIGELEAQTRELREHLARLNSTLVCTGLDEGNFSLEDLGFEGYVGKNAFELVIPYDWIYFSTKHIFQPKYIAQWKHLRTSWNLWYIAIGEALMKMKNVYTGKRPMRRAKITIQIYFPTSHLRDPDHFWFRPVLDSFVQNAWLLNDSSDCVRIETRYYFNREHPMCKISVHEHQGEWDDSDVQMPLKRAF